MPAGVRPNKKLSKLLYKIMKTPKTLQQTDKDIPKESIVAWQKENLPTNPGIL